VLTVFFILFFQGSKTPLAPSSTFFIECEIDLKLPSSVNDLLPPDTLIKSKLIKGAAEVDWSTTLTYCLSTKLFNHLVKQDTKLRLKICPTTDQHDHIFDMSLCDAKYLQDTRDTNEVQQYLEHDAPYIPVMKKCNLELHCGLFVVDMPEKLEPHLQNKHTIYPQIRQSGSNDASSMGTTECTETVYSSHSEDSLISHITGDFSTISKSSAASSIPPTYQQIGSGRDLHTLYFNLVSTNFTIPSSKPSADHHATDDKLETKIFFQYQLFGEHSRIHIHEGPSVGNVHMSFQVRGSIQDILDWLNTQERMRISICYEDSYGNEVEIGHSMIALANIFVPIANDGKQSFYNRAPNRNVPVYDNQNKLVLQSKTSISSLNVQAGLFPNWVYNEAETHGEKPIFHSTESNHHPEPRKNIRLPDQDILPRSNHLSSSAYPRSPNSSPIRVLHKSTISKDMHDLSNNESRTPLQDAQTQTSKSMNPRCRRSYTCSR
jgi:hypothetical protein